MADTNHVHCLEDVDVHALLCRVQFQRTNSKEIHCLLKSGVLKIKKRNDDLSDFRPLFIANRFLLHGCIYRTGRGFHQLIHRALIWGLFGVALLVSAGKARSEDEYCT